MTMFPAGAEFDFARKLHIELERLNAPAYVIAFARNCAASRRETGWLPGIRSVASRAG